MISWEQKECPASSSFTGKEIKSRVHSLFKGREERKSHEYVSVCCCCDVMNPCQAIEERCVMVVKISCTRR